MTSAAPRSDEQITVIDAGARAQLVQPRTLWRYRELIYFLARRDVSIRYKESVIGIAWAVLQPVLLAVVFSVFLGLLAKVPSDHGVPYPVFALAGLVLWMFFAQALARTSDSAVVSGPLISKVWFPRIVIPVAAALPPTLDFVIAVFVVIGSMLIYGVAPSPFLFLVPLIVPLALVTVLGFGIWLAALNVRYRDVNVAVPFLLQVGLFVTPIVYPFSIVPESAQPFYALNPMVGVLELYRWTLFDAAPFPELIVLLPLAIIPVLLVAGSLYFARAEGDFADVI
jgi:lipopolysaccharide transport system permease protein